jgi:hypothetical protein
MPHILVLSLYGKSFFAKSQYPTLLTNLLAKATVHESLTFEDATQQIHSGSPSIILVTDPVITYRQNHEFAKTLAKWVRNGGTAILMGAFPADVEWPDLNALFQLFQKGYTRPWCMIAYTKERVKLNTKHMVGMRIESLPARRVVRGTFIKNVERSAALYEAKNGDMRLCSAAFGQVGFGWLGYLGSMEFSEESEKVVLAMCRMDEVDEKAKEEGEVKHES